MRLILLLVAVTVLATLLMVLAPAMLEVVLDVIVSIVVFVTYVLVIAVSFSIASLVFFTLCLRFTISGEALDDPYANQNVLQHVMWTRWG